jgi:ligand-binding sensor domain-containing protein
MAGSYGDGLFLLDGGRAEGVDLPTPNGKARYVQSVLEDSAGRLWVGAYAEGLFRIHASGVLR